MANRYWLGTTSTSWNNTANWSGSSGGASGASVPGASDDVFFDGNGNNNCTLDVNASANSIDFAAGYTAVFDAATYNVSCGNMTSAQGGGTFDLGSGTWTIAGNWDETSSLATVVHGGSTLLFTGTAKTATFRAVLGSVEISGSISTSSTGSRVIASNLTVKSGGTLTPNKQFRVQDNSGVLTIEAGGVVELGSQILQVIGGDVVHNGTINFTSGNLNIPGSTTVLGGASAYPNIDVRSVLSGTHTCSLGSNIKINGWIRGGQLVGTQQIDLSGYDLEIRGDVDLNYYGHASATAWLSGTGTVTCTGTAAQNLNFRGESVDDLVIDKSAGAATMSGAVNLDGLALNRGTLDIDGQAVDVSGNVTANPTAGAVTMQDTAGTGTLSVTGNIDLNGTATHGVTWTDVDIDALGSGTNDADYCTVSNSNNSSGNAIDATDNCTDSGGNAGWTFTGGPATHEAALSFGTMMSATPTVNAILEASASFAASQSVSSDNIATLSASLSFGGSLGYSTDGTIATGPQTIEAALSIGVVQSLDSISIANLYAATTVGSSLAVTVAGGSAIEAAISYALTQSTAQTADISIEGALAFGVNQSLQNQAQADLTASATLAHQVSLQLIAGAVLNAGLSLSSIQSVSTNGFNLIVGIVTPDGRTITIRAEDRTITIQ